MMHDTGAWHQVIQATQQVTSQFEEATVKAELLPSVLQAVLCRIVAFWKLRKYKEVNPTPAHNEGGRSVHAGVCACCMCGSVPVTTPFTEGCGGVNYQTLPPGRSNMLYF